MVRTVGNKNNRTEQKMDQENILKVFQSQIGKRSRARLLNEVAETSIKFDMLSTGRCTSIVHTVVDFLNYTVLNIANHALKGEREKGDILC